MKVIIQIFTGNFLPFIAFMAIPPVMHVVQRHAYAINISAYDTHPVN
jgi:hypothetical protein